MICRRSFLKKEYSFLLQKRFWVDHTIKMVWDILGMYDWDIYGMYAGCIWDIHGHALAMQPRTPVPEKLQCLESASGRKASALRPRTPVPGEGDRSKATGASSQTPQCLERASPPTRTGAAAPHPSAWERASVPNRTRSIWKPQCLERATCLKASALRPRTPVFGESKHSERAPQARHPSAWKGALQPRAPVPGKGRAFQSSYGC